ncbi:MAG: hypothetical protein MJZ57_01370 [Bacteroidales bacterium]|nr:hypothetical protein [Bacteroidales bacterium]
MKNRINLLLCVLAFANVAFAQSPVLVMESSFKVKAKDTVCYYFSFAAGDQIILDFYESNGLDLKQIEVVELPYVVKYADFKVSSVEDKVIEVPKTAVYAFKFINPTIVGHTCELKIQRKPKSYATAKFNTSWTWKTVYDTSYVYQTEDSIVGYDSIPIVENVKELVSDEIREQMLLDNMVEVKAKGIVKKDDPRVCLTFTLPANKQEELKTEQVLAWAYWVAVGKNANSVWSKNKDLTKSAVKQVAKFVGIASPLAALALGVGVDLIIPDDNNVDNVEYAVFNTASYKDQFMSGQTYRAYQRGFGTGGYGRIDEPKLCQGKKYICLYNDNMHQRIRVSVKASAIVETKTYKVNRYERYDVRPRYVPVNRTKMVVNSHEERVPVID